MTVRRIVLVTVEGLDIKAIERLSLFNLSRLLKSAAVSPDALSEIPPTRSVWLASLLTGVSRERHGVTSEKWTLERGLNRLEPVPQCITTAGFQVSAFLPQMNADASSQAKFIGRQLGFQQTTCRGANATEIVSSALNALCTQRRGLVALAFPDLASKALTPSSSAYADAARCIDRAIGILSSLSGASSGDSLLMIVGANRTDGRLSEPVVTLERSTFLLLMSGQCVRPRTLGSIDLLDIPPTILWALGVSVPLSYEGRAVTEPFAPPAVASEVRRSFSG